MIDKEAIKARLEAATPGPWKYVPCTGEYGEAASAIDGAHDCVVEPDSFLLADDAEFIAHAPTDIANLLEEVERLEAELAKFRECEDSFCVRGDDLLFHTLDSPLPTDVVTNIVVATRKVYHKEGE